MSLYTKLGAGLWSWKPFLDLEHSHDDVLGRCSRLFWIALYTAREAKLVPGLFWGSITTMAETAHIPVDDARTYLDRLLEHEMVQVDLRQRVLRMTMLPDAGESPPNGKAIRGWWNRFQGIPICEVRDAHVEVLYWIMQEWSRANGKPISHDHVTAWSETFGRLPMKTFRRRAPEFVQTSLFEASDPKINNLDSISDTVSSWSRNQQDQDPDKDQDQDLGSGGQRAAKKPTLVLVPHPAFDADDLAEVLWKATGGTFPQALTKTQRVALGRAIDAIGEISLHPQALAGLGEYVASLNDLRGGAGMAAVSVELVTSPGWIAAAIKRGMEWRAPGAEVTSE